MEKQPRVHASEAVSMAQPKRNEWQDTDTPQISTASRRPDVMTQSTAQDTLDALSKRFNVDEIADQFSIF